MKNLFGKLRSKGVAIKGAVGAAAIAMSASASAALPTEVTDAIAALTTNATEMIVAFWPYVISVVGGLILIRLFKKSANTSS